MANKNYGCLMRKIIILHFNHGIHVIFSKLMYMALMIRTS